MNLPAQVIESKGKDANSSADYLSSDTIRVSVLVSTFFVMACKMFLDGIV